MTPNMPLWLALLDDDEVEQLGSLREGDDPRSWIARTVDEIIAEEESDTSFEFYDEPSDDPLA